MQCCCGVVEGEEHGTSVLTALCLCVRTSVHLGNLGAWRKDSQGVPPKRGDDSWLERLDLPGEEWGARCSLRLLWIAVSRWSTLHRIQDEHLLTAKADRGQQIVEEAARGTHKGAASLILTGSRGFPNKHNLRRGAPLTRDRLCSGRGEFARRTAGGIAGDRSKFEGDSTRSRGSLRGPDSC